MAKGKESDTTTATPAEVEEVNDHDDQVVEVPGSGEKLHIPSEKVTTEMKDTEGQPIPDRILTALHNEHVNYPDEINGYLKVGELKVNQDVKNILPNSGGKTDPQSEQLVVEIQQYENEKGETMKIKKSVQKKYYPTVLKLREMAQSVAQPNPQ
jgi:hypothetical protein